MPKPTNYIVIKGCSELDKEFGGFKFFDTAKDALFYRDKECNNWDAIYKKVDLKVVAE